MADHPDVEHIEDEDTLEYISSRTEDLELKKRIRRRLRELTDRRLAAYESHRYIQLQTEEDVVTARLRKAKEEKERRMRQFQEQARLRGQAINPTEDLVLRRQQEAEHEKQQKLEQYKQMGRVISVAYNSGVTDIIKEKNQPVNDAHVNSSPAPGTPNQVRNVYGFGGTDYTNKPAKTSAAQPNSPNRVSPFTCAPSAIKQTLLDWCRTQVAGYNNVNITNFSSSWADGLAFCALIHRFYPNAFDFKQLTPKNRRGNFSLAFSTAEKLADIYPILDVEDMVRMKNPDWKCVFAYVQTIYQRFAGQQK